MKVKKSTIYIFFYALCGFIEVLTYSRYSDIIPQWIFSGIKISVIFALIIIQFDRNNLQNKISLKKLFLVILIVTSLIFVYINSTIGLNLILIMVFMLSGKDIKYKKLLRASLISLLTGWGFVTLSSLLGIIENRVYTHSFVGTISKTYGFNYYAYPSMLCFTCGLIYLYLRKKIKLLDIIIVLLINYTASLVYTTRIYFLTMIVFAAWLLLTEITHFIQLNSRVWNFIATAGYSLCYIGNFIFYYLYNPANPIWVIINQFSTGRLKIGNEAISDYKITLFGQKIIMYGNVERVYGNITTGQNYIDSGYLYSVLSYGIIFSLVLIICYTIIFRFLLKSNEKFLFGWMVMFMLLNIPNNYLLSIFINPLLLLFMPALKTINPVNKRKNL